MASDSLVGAVLLKIGDGANRLKLHAVAEVGAIKAPFESVFDDVKTSRVHWKSLSLFY